MSEVFWTFFITSMIGLILKGGSMLYKSKCREVSCCCIKIVRDIEAELEVDTLPPTNQPPPPPNLMAIAERGQSV
jgi:hypothetical protein